MADPPPIRRPPTKPPPIPRIVAPAPAQTDVVAAQISPLGLQNDDTGDEPQPFDENTRNLEAPDASQLVGRMLDLVASEAEALLVGDDADGRLADLNVRTALAAWDGLHQPDEAMRYLELAERHPLAPRLRLSAALAAVAPAGAPDPAPLAAVAEKLADPTSPEARRSRSSSPRRGCSAIAAPSSPRPSPIACSRPAPRRRGTRMSSSSPCSLTRRRDRGRASWSSAAPRSPKLRRPEDIAATCALILDRGKDAAGALALCWAAIERDGCRAERARDRPLGGGHPWRLAAGDRRRDRRRLARRGPAPPRAPRPPRRPRRHDHRRRARSDRDTSRDRRRAGARRPACRGREAVERDRRRSGRRGARREPPDRDLRDRARRVRRRRSGGRVRRAPAPDRQRCARGGRDARAGARSSSPRWPPRPVPNPSPSSPIWSTAPRRHRSPSAGSISSISPRRRSARSRASSRAVGSRCGGRPRSPNVSISACARSSCGAVRPRSTHAWAPSTITWSGSCVAARRGPGPRASLPTRTGSPRSTRRGRGPSRIRAAPRRCSARAASSTSCAVTSSWPRRRCSARPISIRRTRSVAPPSPPSTAPASATTSSRACSRSCRPRWSAATAAPPLRASTPSSSTSTSVIPAGARTALERMIADRPDDDATMLVLARLYDGDQQWTKSIELRERAVAVAPTPERRAEIWVEIALREDRRGQRDAALAALDQAAAITPGRPEVLREQARIHRQAGQYEQALEIVRAELATDPPLARRMQLQSERAQLLTALDREPETVVAAYLDVLSIEPDQTEALAGIEAPARKLGLWDELARAFRGAPPDRAQPRGARRGARQDRRVERARRGPPPPAREPRRPRPRRRGARPSSRGSYEHELGDLDGAIRMLVVAQANVPDDARQQDLLRLLRAHRALGRDGAARSSASCRRSPRPIRSRARSSSCSSSASCAPTSSIAGTTRPPRFEAVLERDPKNPIALERLETLYEQLGRDRELRAAARGARRGPRPSRSRARRCSIASPGCARAAATSTARSRAYTAAFTANPTNREIFTAMERVCYKAERWAAAMQLYETAIAHVESGQGQAARAYRLGDLYAGAATSSSASSARSTPRSRRTRRSSRSTPSPRAAVKVLDDLCRQRKDWAPLIAAWERRAEIQRDPARRADALRAAAALATERAEDPRASVRLNRKLLAVDPGDLGAAATLERYYEENQDRSGLIDVLKVRLQHAPANETVELLKRIARASEEGARDVDTATEHYLKILELQPDNRDALEALGRIYESTEQWAEFIDVTRRQIKVTTDRNTKALLVLQVRLGDGGQVRPRAGRDPVLRRRDQDVAELPARGPRPPRSLPPPRGVAARDRDARARGQAVDRGEGARRRVRADRPDLRAPARRSRARDDVLRERARGRSRLPAGEPGAVRALLRSPATGTGRMPIASSLAQKAMRDGDPIDAQRVLSQARRRRAQ